MYKLIMEMIKFFPLKIDSIIKIKKKKLDFI